MTSEGAPVSEPEQNVEPATPGVTTVETNEWKSKIDPYAPTPVLQVDDGVIACAFCGNTRFRRSRVRFQDLREILMLRYPMRCMRCNQRQYGYFLTAGLALGPRDHANRMSQGKETWKAWTEADMKGMSTQRPMSTSIGPRATKLERPVRKPAALPKKGGEGWRDDDRQIW